MLIQKAFTAAPMVASITITLPSWADGPIGIALAILLLLALYGVFKKEYGAALTMVVIAIVVLILFNDGIGTGPLSGAFSNKGVEILSEPWD